MGSCLLKYLIVFGIFTLFARGQAPYGSFIDYKVLPSMDTLVLHRSYGDWWYGLFVSGSYNVNFGKLFIPERPYLPVDDTINRLLIHESKNGFNTSSGLMVEYNPKGSYWGGALRLTFLEGRLVKSYAEVSSENLFSAIIDYRTIVLSPSVRYNFSVEGLHIFGGFDIEYLYDNKSKLQQTEFKDGTRIVTDWVLSAAPKSFRFGLHLGAGWDLLLLDVAQLVRVRWKPYISLHYGTAFFNGYNSNLNTLFLRAGLAVSFGPDDVNSEYHKFDSAYVKPPEAIVSTPPIVRPGVFFSGFTKPIEFPGVELNVVDISRIKQELGLNEQERIAGEIKVPVPEKKEVQTFQLGQTIVLQQYPRSEVTTLTEGMKNLLDALAEFLIANPEYKIVIEGHSDNQGTPQQNLQRSQQRAQEAYNYLIKRKVNRDRMRWSGRSAFVPKADNFTEEGRRQNRRIEILIIK